MKDRGEPQMSKDKEKANGSERKGTAVEERASGRSGVLQAHAGQQRRHRPWRLTPLGSPADGRPDY